MKTRKLGTSNIEISEIGLGTNYVGGHNLYADVDESAGIALVKKALDEGITFIDTADIYGTGRSEELVGKALGKDRSRVVLATKGANIFEGQERSGVSNRPEYLRKALEASLRRLGTDYVDLYYIHKPDGQTPVEEAYGALMEFKQEGKIRAGGLSNFGVEAIQAAMKVGPVDAVQNRYNLFQREAEKDVLPFCDDNGISFIPWGPLAYGLLSGKYERDFVLDPKDWRNRTELFDNGVFEPTLDIVDKLKEIAGKLGAPVAHLAMAWLLTRPGIGSVIAGAKNSEQVGQNAEAAALEISPETAEAISFLTGE